MPNKNKKRGGLLSSRISTSVMHLKRHYKAEENKGRDKGGDQTVGIRGSRWQLKAFVIFSPTI